MRAWATLQAQFPVWQHGSEGTTDRRENQETYQRDDERKDHEKAETVRGL